MQFVLMGLMALGIVAADQLLKFWVVAHIPEGGFAPGIDGIFHFTYVQNTGAAFSSFQGMQWLFAVVFLIFTAVVIWEFSAKRMPFTKFERWMIAAIYAGGLGNMIDRVRLGYVVDMFCLDFVKFAVFNVADCFITCGCIVLVVHLIFFNKDFWKEEKK